MSQSEAQDLSQLGMLSASYLLLVVTFRLHHLWSLIPPQMHFNSQLIHVQWHCNACSSPTSSSANVGSRASCTCVKDGIAERYQCSVESLVIGYNFNAVLLFFSRSKEL